MQEVGHNGSGTVTDRETAHKSRSLNRRTTETSAYIFFHARAAAPPACREENCPWRHHKEGPGAGPLAASSPASPAQKKREKRPLDWLRPDSFRPSFWARSSAANSA